MNEVIQRVLQFRDSRNWSQFHTPENLSKSIVIEASELLELFQWSSEVDQTELSDELADVFVYAILLMNHYGLNFEEIIFNKIKKNEEKYPVEKAYGKSTKYNKL